MNMTDDLNVSNNANADSLAILEEAHSVIVGRTKSTIPDVPDSLKHQIVERRSDIFI